MSEEIKAALSAMQEASSAAGALEERVRSFDSTARAKRAEVVKACTAMLNEILRPFGMIARVQLDTAPTETNSVTS